MESGRPTLKTIVLRAWLDCCCSTGREANHARVLGASCLVGQSLQGGTGSDQRAHPAIRSLDSGGLASFALGVGRFRTADPLLADRRELQLGGSPRCPRGDTHLRPRQWRRGHLAVPGSYHRDRPDAVTGPQPLRGFFLEPKLLVSVYRISLLLGPPPYDFPGPYGDRHFLTSSISIGLDVGYQIVWGHLYLAVMGGLAVGYCHNCSPDGFASGLVTEYSLRRTNRLALDLNLNLLRIGFAW